MRIRVSGVLYASAILPIVAGLALLLDFSRVLSARAHAESAAQSAAQLAVKSARAGLEASAARDGGDAVVLASAQTEAEAAFTALYAERAHGLGAAMPHVSVSRRGDRIVSTVVFDGQADAMFAKMLGLQKIHFTGAQAAAGAAPPEPVVADQQAGTGAATASAAREEGASRVERMTPASRKGRAAEAERRSASRKG